MRFDEMLKHYGLEDRVELKGAFCMERCSEGLNWQIDDEALSSPGVDDAVSMFVQRIVAPMAGTQDVAE